MILRDNIKGGALTETTFLILLATCNPMHGYGIMQFIENETSGRVTLGAGTLYGAISTLQKKHWIEPVSDNKRDEKNSSLHHLADKSRQMNKGDLLTYPG